MSEQKLKVIVKSISLMNDIMSVTSNRKRFPVKYVILVNRIQEKCMDIYEYLMDANRTDVVANKVIRNELQTKAVTACDKLSCYIELSMNQNLISTGLVENLQKKIDDIKYMTIAWRSKDKNR